jgi:dihydrofolate reductase
VPVFVVTHRARAKVTKGETSFTFVTDGIEGAVKQAEAAAGAKNVGVGGASTAQQVMKAGLLDEVQINLVPILLGDGRRLFDKQGEFELETIRVIEAPGVTHLRFRVTK